MSKKTEALIGRLKDVLESEADKEAAIERARSEAIGRTETRWLSALDEPTRAAIFAGREAVATARDRKLIAGHPMRPGATDTQSGIKLGVASPTLPSKDGTLPDAK